MICASRERDVVISHALFSRHHQPLRRQSRNRHIAGGPRHGLGILAHLLAMDHFPADEQPSADTPNSFHTLKG